MAENLMLNRAQQDEIERRRPVNDRLETHLEASIIAGEAPGRAFIVLRRSGSGALRNVEGDPVKLVRAALMKNHVLACSRGIAEAIADIETEGTAVKQTRGRAPIPGVVVDPDAAAPVEHARGARRVEAVFDAPCLDLAARGHAVDLLVVIEGARRAREGRRNDHAVHLRLVEP